MRGVPVPEESHRALYRIGSVSSEAITLFFHRLRHLPVIRARWILVRYCDWSGQVGSGRVGSGRVGSGRVGSGRVGSGRVGSGRVESGRVGWGGVGWSAVAVLARDNDILSYFFQLMTPAICSPGDGAGTRLNNRRRCSSWTRGRLNSRVFLHHHIFVTKRLRKRESRYLQGLHSGGGRR